MERWDISVFCKSTVRHRDLMSAVSVGRGHLDENIRAKI